MKQLWYSRKNLPGEYQDCRLWPQFDEGGLDVAEAARVRKYRTAIATYLDWKPFGATCNELGVCKAEVLRLLNNCVSAHPDGRIYGWRALEFGVRLKQYVRTARVSSGPNGGGMSGALTKLFCDYPDIQSMIDALILKEHRADVIHESRIGHLTIHQEFIRLCAEAKISRFDYPFNTQLQGQRAISKYAREKRLANFSKGATVMGGRNATKIAALGKGYEKHMIAERPFDLCSIDAHRLDFHGSIAVSTPKGDQWIALQRMQFMPVIENYSTAILGCKVAIRRESSAVDALEAINQSLHIWQPRQLRLAGMVYPEGAGFPSLLIPALQGVGWGALMLDNATIHYSVAVKERARRRIGCAINWGPVGQWSRRDLIENLFGALERRGFQRLPNTTGSNPVDTRRDDPTGTAIGLKMHWEEMLDLIDIVCATYNITPRKGLGWRSPIQILRDCIEHPNGGFLPRRLPDLPASQPELDVVVETRFVRGSLMHGRRPYVEIDGVHYTNELLSRAGLLIGKSLTVHIRERDMRTVTVFLTSGSELGVLVAQGTWGRIKHDRQTRKQINRLIYKRLLTLKPGDEPIQAFLRLKAEQAIRETSGSKTKNKHVSKAATELASAVEMTGQEVPEVIPDGLLPASDSALASTHVTTPLPRFIKRAQHRAILKRGGP